MGGVVGNNSRVEEQNRGRLRQIKDVGRTHGVDNIDTEANSHKGKTGNLEGGGLEGRRLKRGKIDHDFGLGII